MAICSGILWLGLWYGTSSWTRTVTLQVLFLLEESLHRLLRDRGTCLWRWRTFEIRLSIILLGRLTSLILILSWSYSRLRLSFLDFHQELGVQFIELQTWGCWVSVCRTGWGILFVVWSPVSVFVFRTSPIRVVLQRMKLNIWLLELLLIVLLLLRRRQGLVWRYNLIASSWVVLLLVVMPGRGVVCWCTVGAPSLPHESGGVVDLASREQLIFAFLSVLYWH